MEEKKSFKLECKKRFGFSKKKTLLNDKKDSPIKMGKGLSKHFTKESMWAANKPIKDAHGSLLERHKLKPLHECYFTALLVTTSKATARTNVGRI